MAGGIVSGSDGSNAHETANPSRLWFADINAWSALMYSMSQSVGLRPASSIFCIDVPVNASVLSAGTTYVC